MSRFLTDLRDYLITAGVVRDPTTVGSLPPCWRMPRDGTPAPGEGNNVVERGADVVVGIWRSGELAPAVCEGSFRADWVDFTIRSRTAPLGEDFEEALRAALIDRQNFRLTPTGERIQQTEVFRGFSFVHADQQAFNWNVGYLFRRYFPALNA